MPILYYSIGYYATHIQQRLLQVKGMEADALSIVHDAVSMLPVVTAFSREDHELARFRRKTGHAIDARVDITVRQTLFSLAVNMTTAIGTALVLGFGSYQALRGRAHGRPAARRPGLHRLGLQAARERSATRLASLQDNLVGLRMAFHILDTEPEIRERARAETHRPRGRRASRFDDVSVQLPRPVGHAERHLVRSVRPARSIAIVGPTGAGKTTLTSLIPRFYDPQRGRMLLDGRDIRTLTLESLRRHISIVPQEPLLFSGTIADNIRYGRLEATMDEIVAAARAANAHDFIARLPTDTRPQIGERGVQLSGGERQRICVARAFLKDAPILILDEPTSSIDSKTEAVILDALDRLMVGRTTFMIAHRLSTSAMPT